MNGSSLYTLVFKIISKTFCVQLLISSECKTRAWPAMTVNETDKESIYKYIYIYMYRPHLYCPTRHYRYIFAPVINSDESSYKIYT